MASLVGPTGRVIAFEPDPENVEILRENCAENGAGNVEVRHCALGARPGRLTLHRLILNSGENHLGREEKAAFSRVVEVDVAAAGSWVVLHASGNTPPNIAYGQQPFAVSNPIFLAR